MTLSVYIPVSRYLFTTFNASLSLSLTLFLQLFAIFKSIHPPCTISTPYIHQHRYPATALPHSEIRPPTIAPPVIGFLTCKFPPEPPSSYNSNYCLNISGPPSPFCGRYAYGSGTHTPACPSFRPNSTSFPLPLTFLHIDLPLLRPGLPEERLDVEVPRKGKLVPIDLRKGGDFPRRAYAR